MAKLAMTLKTRVATMTLFRREDSKLKVRLSTQEIEIRTVSHYRRRCREDGEDGAVDGYSPSSVQRGL